MSNSEAINTPNKPPSLYDKYKSFRSYLASLHDPEVRDKEILKAIDKTQVPIKYKPGILKIAGSSKLRQEYISEIPVKQADSLEPIFQKQVERGRLSQERAAALRQSILDGEVKQMAYDSFISMVIFGIIEKAAIPAVAYGVYQAGYPELSGVMLYSLTANPTAVPYFLYRTAQEVIEHNKKLTEQQTPIAEKVLRLSGTALEGLTATQMNLWPFPASIYATASVPLLNRQRNNELFKVIIDYHVGNGVESTTVL